MPILREIIFGAVRRGASIKELLNRSGINKEQLQNAELNIPFEQAQAVWTHAVKLTGDDLLGLHIGKDTTTSIVGLTGHLMQTSPDLRTAFEQVCSFNQVFTNMFYYHLVESKGKIILEYKPAVRWEKTYPETAMQAVDQALSGTLHVFKLLSGKHIVPAKVQLGQRSNKHRTEYENAFETSVVLNSDGNRLYFTADQLAEPVLSYDKKLFTVFSSMLTRQKKELKKSDSASSRINQLLQEV